MTTFRHDMQTQHALPLAALLVLVACTPAPSPVTEPDTTPPPVVTENAAPIPLGNIETTTAGRCFTDTAPETETKIITEEVEIVPAVIGDDGRVLAPPVFRSQSRPVTATRTAGTRFETVCLDEYTPERIATLQRALTARAAYSGPVTSSLDDATRAAIRTYQAPLGFDSPLLNREIAQSLGILPLPVLRADLPEN